MLSADNYLSNILFIEKETTTNILVFIEFGRIMTEEEIHNYVETIVRKNTILRQYIVRRENQLFLENDTDFDIKKQYSVSDDPPNKTKLLNSEYKTKSRWFCSFVSENKDKTSLFVKVDHSLADGHQLIRILTSPFSVDQTTNQFKRTSRGIFNKVYYWFVGTIVLILTLLKFVCKVLFQWKTTRREKNKPTKFMEFDAFSLSTIKNVCSQHNITVNDFMYAVLLKSYTSFTRKTSEKKKTNIYTISPIHISGKTHTNNVCPLLLNVAYSDDNPTLLQNVHSAFNNCKYSLFVPVLSFLLQMVSDYVNPELLSTMYRIASDNIDVVYSNVIGPTIPDINNIAFVMNAQPNQLCYNVISCKDKLNLIVSFQDGFVKDEAFLKRCLTDAYNELINV